jgi:hypothetical protein
MSRRFRSDDTVKWQYGFGYGQVDATISANETYSWNGTTRFGSLGQISGTAGNTSFTKPAGWAHEGFCLLHQTKGTGVGAYELAYVDFSGASAVADRPLQNTYTTSGGSVAQAITLSNGTRYSYNNLTINSGVTVYVPKWNGSTGGIMALLVRNTLTINGIISGNGNSGSKGTTNNGGGGGGIGFRGGGRGAGSIAMSGEGTTGGPTDNQTTANANGAGAGSLHSGGNGGGHAASGGQNSGFGAPSGTVGGTVGNTSLTSLNFGGGGSGGSGSTTSPTKNGGGGGGGGIIFIIAKNIVVSGSLRVNGGPGGDAYTTDWNARPAGPGGGGGGGSILIKAQTATLGTSKVTATGGAAGNETEYGNRDAGAGGVGRIHLDYKSSYSGSTSPNMNVTNDKSLVYRNGSILPLL